MVGHGWYNVLHKTKLDDLKIAQFLDSNAVWFKSGSWTISFEVLLYRVLIAREIKEF